MNFTVDSAREAISELDKAVAVVETLTADREVLIGYLRAREHADFWNRTIVRANFADWEARLFQFRRICLALNSVGIIKVTPEELLCLKDEKVYVSDSGTVKVGQARTSTVSSFRFVFSTLSKSLGIPNHLKTDGKEWEEFRKTILIRDRLMHPKDASDLDLNDEDTQLINRTSLWIENVFKVTTVDAGPRFIERIRELKLSLSDDLAV